MDWIYNSKICNLGGLFHFWPGSSQRLNLWIRHRIPKSVYNFGDFAAFGHQKFKKDQFDSVHGSWGPTGTQIPCSGEADPHGKSVMDLLRAKQELSTVQPHWGYFPSGNGKGWEVVDGSSKSQRAGTAWAGRLGKRNWRAGWTCWIYPRPSLLPCLVHWWGTVLLGSDRTCIPTYNQPETWNFGSNWDAGILDFSFGQRQHQGREGFSCRWGHTLPKARDLCLTWELQQHRANSLLSQFNWARALNIYFSQAIEQWKLHPTSTQTQQIQVQPDTHGLMGTATNVALPSHHLGSTSSSLLRKVTEDTGQPPQQVT